MTDKGEDYRQVFAGSHKVYDKCPNCGHSLSPWQQVLLTVDRALVCKNCWYRIILDITEDEKYTPPAKERG